MTKPRNSNELPSEVLKKMDPELVDEYYRLPPELNSRITELMKKALQLPIHPNRICKYAFLYASAEIQAREEELSKEHAAKSKRELEGELHSFPTGYRDGAEARQLYRRGRQARQHVGAALDGLVKKLASVEQVVQAHRSNLPTHLQAPFSKESLAQVHKLIHVMVRSTILDDEYVREDDTRWPTATNQTYLWWERILPDYRGKWKDMHRLANVWRLSGVATVETFRNMFARLRQKRRSRGYLFPGTWESLLSKKP